jgi:hypothetical protein
MSTRKLTDEERMNKGIELAGALDELAQIEFRKREFSREIKDEISDTKSLITRLRRETSSGEVEINPQLSLKESA